MLPDYSRLLGPKLHPEQDYLRAILETLLRIEAQGASPALKSKPKPKTVRRPRSK